jgi:hypothetical protein
MKFVERDVIAGIVALTRGQRGWFAKSATSFGDSKGHGAFSEVPDGLDRCGFVFRLLFTDLESLAREVQVHQIHRSLDGAEIGFDRYHPSGFAQWCQFSVRSDRGGQRAVDSGALGPEGVAG